MALTIEWTEEAEKQLDNIIEYLETNWTEKEIKSFFRKLEKGIKTISNKPLQQKKSERKSDTYEYHLSHQTTIFYTFDKEQLPIMILGSNRMNPERL